MLARLVAALDRGLGREAAGEPPPPWLGWLAVALLRHRVRQRWHRDVVAKLPADGGDDEDRDVPGMPGWKYYFHGIGCCLTGPDGEILDVDSRDEHAAVIDPWFFTRRMKSLRQSGVVERSLWRWLPHEGLIGNACKEWLRVGALVPFQGEHLFQLAEPLETRADAVAAQDMADQPTIDRWSRALGSVESPALVAAHRAWLKDLVFSADGARATDALEGAAEVLSEADLHDTCVRIIGGHIGPATGKAIEILRARGARDVVVDVGRLLDRLSPTDDRPYPAYQALAYLFEHTSDPAAIAPLFQRFSAVERAAGFLGNPFLGDYAVLALRFLPDRAMNLVRRALRSDTPVCVSDVAGLLAAIDMPWCHRELAAALEAETPARAYLLEALRRSSGDLAAARAERAYIPPRRAPGGIGFTYEEVLDHNVAEAFEPALEKARLLAEAIRARYPPDWTG
ncbi:MAG TPA: hypothetical protein VN903_00125 [Polyangia bacterium]|jgi:hypothetical protein|nr:hypothetical protein [Polyangia bacterium]